MARSVDDIRNEIAQLEIDRDAIRYEKDKQIHALTLRIAGLKKGLAVRKTTEASADAAAKYASIWTAHHVDSKSIAAIASDLGVTQSRVRQLLAKAESVRRLAP